MKVAVFGLAALSCCLPIYAAQSDAQAALQAFAKTFASLFARCGAVYVGRDISIMGTNGDIVELKGVSWALLQQQPLTPADRENGYQWKGLIRWRFSVSRVARPPDQRLPPVWGEWGIATLTG